MTASPTPRDRLLRAWVAMGQWRVMLIVGLVVLVAIAILAPQFFGTRNLVNVSRQGSIVGVVAVGMTIVILTGGIDLSVGSILALSTVTVAWVAGLGVPLPLAAVAAVVVGGLAGALNGVGVAVLQIQPFVMTLASMVALRGLSLRLTDGGPRPFRADSPMMDFFGAGQLLGVPGPFIVFVLTALAGWLLLRYLPFGRYLYAIGGSVEAARLSGVPIRGTLIRAYVISGALAGLAGFMTAARLSIGDPSGGSLLELDAIAAVVIGGTSLAGGIGGILGTFFGALLLAVVANVMNLVGVSPFDQFIVKGSLIVVAVLVGAQAARRRGGVRRHRRSGLTTTGPDPGGRAAAPDPTDPTDPTTTDDRITDATASHLKGTP